MTVQVRRAVPADAATIIEWRAERAAWLADRGLDQWGTAGLDPSAFAGRVAASIEAGETWILDRGHAPVATMAVDEHSDPSLWTDAETLDALFLHRVISPLASAGLHVAAPLLAHAHDLAAQRQRRWLRLDAWSTNTALHTFWEHRGFDHVRTVPAVASGALFQRRVSG